MRILNSEIDYTTRVTLPFGRKYTHPQRALYKAGCPGAYNQRVLAGRLPIFG